MKKKHNKNNEKNRNIAKEHYDDGFHFLSSSIFNDLKNTAKFMYVENEYCTRDTYAVILSNGTIYCNTFVVLTPIEWGYIFAHCLLHLGFGHFQKKENQLFWNIACDIVTTKFLKDIKFLPPITDKANINSSDVDALYDKFLFEGKVGDEYKGFGTSKTNIDMIIVDEVAKDYKGNIIDWEKIFANNIANSLVNTVNNVTNSVAKFNYHSNAYKAKRWFIDNYPLLGSLASIFDIITEPSLCSREDIAIAAVNEDLKEIYMNETANLDFEECKFVMAHEILHVGLRHRDRCKGRDHYLWNVACDYVINSWLIEMGIGIMPDGLLYDETLKGLSAEAIYDIIVKDLRKYKKLFTLTGRVGVGDILSRSREEFGYVDLDNFYKKALLQGMDYHMNNSRGYLPSNLVEEIRALNQPAIPWEVELARWFDNFFPPIEKRRTYARISRRQSSTPDIPRPKWELKREDLDGRTFGVVLDTSGSMDRTLLAKALGSIASYAASRDVPFVRVVFCDAIHYDQGYMSPEDIAGRVKVRGRGGTILQPGVDLIERATDFPDQGPILIITDAECDKVKCRRDHAFLIPKYASLPFKPIGKVFKFN